MAPGNDQVFVGDLFIWDKTVAGTTLFLEAEGRLLAVRTSTGATLRPAWLPIGWVLPAPTVPGVGGVVVLFLLFAGAAGVVKGAVVLHERPLRGATAMGVLVAFVLLPVDAHAGGGGPAVPASGYRWLVTDHVGTSVVQMNSLGDLVNRRVVEPFGRQLAPATGTESAKKFFAGHMLDDDEGLHHAGARTYDPEIGA